MDQPRTTPLGSGFLLELYVGKLLIVVGRAPRTGRLGVAVGDGGCAKDVAPQGYCVRA